jgi:hypothetical protein
MMGERIGVQGTPNTTKCTIGVFLGDAGRRIGTLRFDSQGARQSAAFEYGRQWLAASDRFAFDPDLTLVTGVQFFTSRSRRRIDISWRHSRRRTGWVGRVA